MSWLKFDTATPEKPEVFAITITLGWEDPDLTVGKLLKVWRWFDLHSVDGNASSVTLALLDRLIGVTGLSQAMVDVGWLEVSDNGLTLPNFENHNGKTAKDRALTAKRASNYRSNDKSNAASVTTALPREEKRREEKNQEPKEKKAQAPTAYADLLINVSPQIIEDWKALRKSKKAPVTRTAIEGISLEAAKAGYTLEKALGECCARGWSGFKASWLDDKKSVTGSSYEPPYAKYMREKMEQISPSIAAKNPNNPIKKMDPNEFLRTIEAQNVVRIN